MVAPGGRSIEGQRRKVPCAAKRIEILPDPLALAHHVAEWMTQATCVALGWIGAEDTLSTSRVRRIQGPFPLAAGLLVLGRRTLRTYDHPESNFWMTGEAMLAKAPVPPENVISDHLSRKTACSLIGSRATWSLLAGKSGSGKPTARPHNMDSSAGIDNCARTISE